MKQLISKLISIPQDKLLHFNACLFIAFFSSKLASLIFDKWIGALVGFIIAMVIGGLKELYDLQGHGTPEWKDIKADALGAVTGSVMSLM